MAHMLSDVFRRSSTGCTLQRLMSAAGTQPRWFLSFDFHVRYTRSPRQPRTTASWRVPRTSACTGRYSVPARTAGPVAWVGSSIGSTLSTQDGIATV